MDRFIEDYQCGLTFSLCVRCNDELKFKTFLEWALSLGAKYLATGYYVRIERNQGYSELYRAVYEKKDQSYFLFGAIGVVLDKVLFLLGGMIKEEV